MCSRRFVDNVVERLYTFVGDCDVQYCVVVGSRKKFYYLKTLVSLYIHAL